MCGWGGSQEADLGKRRSERKCQGSLRNPGSCFFVFCFVVFSFRGGGGGGVQAAAGVRQDFLNPEGSQGNYNGPWALMFTPDEAELLVDFDWGGVPF